LPSYAAVQQQPTVSLNQPAPRSIAPTPLHGISIPVLAPHSFAFPPPHLQREVLTQAEEMFRDANKLSRQERILILGFMAGNRGAPLIPFPKHDH
jgi:negative elongation factor A